MVILAMLQEMKANKLNSKLNLDYYYFHHFVSKIIILRCIYQERLFLLLKKLTTMK